jgi:hypothetical protein
LYKKETTLTGFLIQKLQPFVKEKIMNNSIPPSNLPTIFEITDQRLIYQKFEEIGKKYGNLRESFCRKLYQSQRNAYKSGNFGVQEENIFWTRMTYKKIADILNVSVRTAKNIIKDLKEFGIILVGRFKQMLKNFKTGRLMVDNYLAFNLKTIDSSQNLPPPKLSTENPEIVVDKGLQEGGYGAKFAPSYNDISILKNDTKCWDDYPVDNSLELSHSKSSFNNNSIKYLLRKGVNFMMRRQKQKKYHRVLNPERSQNLLEKEPVLFYAGIPSVDEFLDDRDAPPNDELQKILSNWGNAIEKKTLNEEGF